MTPRKVPFYSAMLSMAFLSSSSTGVPGSERVTTDMALDTVVQMFEVNNKETLDVIKELNKISKVPINAEISARRSRPHSFSMRNSRLRDILSEFAKESDQEWHKDGNGIAVVDRGTAGDPKHAMNHVLDSYDIVGKTKSDAAIELFSHTDILEKKFYVVFIRGHSSGSDPEKKLNLHLERATPRAILNAIVEADGSSYWTLFTDDDGDRYLSFGARAKGTSNRSKKNAE